MNVRSPGNEATGPPSARFRIREAALRLWAERGAAVTVRQIAAAARVSSALIIRHFGSSAGLHHDIEKHVLRQFRAILAELQNPKRHWSDPSQTATLAQAAVRHLPPDSPIPRFLSRMLLEDSPAGRGMFRALLAQGEATLQGMAAAGLASASADPAVRAAFLTINDLAVMLLRGPQQLALGFDPLSPDGLERWGREVLAVYAAGIGGRLP